MPTLGERDQKFEFRVRGISECADSLRKLQASKRRGALLGAEKLSECLLAFLAALQDTIKTHRSMGALAVSPSIQKLWLENARNSREMLKTLHEAFVFCLHMLLKGMTPEEASSLSTLHTQALEHMEHLKEIGMEILSESVTDGDDQSTTPSSNL